MSDIVALWHLLYWQKKTGKSTSWAWHTTLHQLDADTCELLSQTGDPSLIAKAVAQIHSIMPGASCLVWLEELRSRT
jgi:hypothetical protein